MTERIIPEAIIEPDLPIIDAHHHLWFHPPAKLDQMDPGSSLAQKMLIPLMRQMPRYLFDDYLADMRSGHNIRASVFVNAHAMYRLDGPPALRSVGEIEFVNGAAAMAASGVFGETRMCAGIVGAVDLSIGDAAREVMEAHLAAGGGRYRGVRSFIIRDDDTQILGFNNAPVRRLQDPRFREGFGHLRDLNLSFDAWLFEPQLPELAELARRFPDTQIILNHVGAPLGIGRYANLREARLPLWCESIRRLSQCPNVAVKLGGLGIPFGGFASYMSSPPATSEQLAADWKPYIDHCIDCFGVERCMFESNFPVDAATASYAVLWNAFKRITSSASADEKSALYSGTAQRLYRLEI